MPNAPKPQKDEAEKPWETAKTSEEMNEILRPKESDRMLNAGGAAPASKPKPSPSPGARDPLADMPTDEAERLRKRNATVTRHVGGGLDEKKQ